MGTFCGPSLKDGFRMGLSRFDSSLWVGWDGILLPRIVVASVVKTTILMELNGINIAATTGSN